MCCEALIGYCAELLIQQEMRPDESASMRNGPQFAIAVNPHIKFEAKGPGGLRLSLMHNLTDFRYYISIFIWDEEIVLGYIWDDYERY